VELAFGILLVWAGAALMWVAFHGTTARTPWDVFQSVVGAATGTGSADVPAGPAPVATP
jgi:hypothetical protein